MKVNYKKQLIKHIDLFLNHLNIIDFVLIHSHDFFENDLDVAIKKNEFKKINKLVNDVSQKCKLLPVQLLQHESEAKYFVLARIQKKNIIFIKFDPCSDFIRDGRILIKSEDFFKDTLTLKNINIPNPKIEAIYLILKKVLKKQFTMLSKKRIIELYNIDAEGVTNEIRKYFTNKYSDKVLSTIKSNDWVYIEKNIVNFRKSILKKTFFNAPHSVIVYHIKNLIRIFKRIIYPTGYVVVFEGPDGCGKSSLSYKISYNLKDAFRRTDIFHWRPGVFPQIYNLMGTIKYQDSSNPHKLPTQNKLISFLRLFYYWLDYVIGYTFKVYKLKIKSSLIVFDRYIYDFYIDPKRFRITLPDWIIKVFILMTPKPDLVIIVKNKADIILKRKQELSRNEILSQYNRIGKLKKFYRNFIEIENDNNINDTVNKINKEILIRLNKRFLRRYLK